MNWLLEKAFEAVLFLVGLSAAFDDSLRQRRQDDPWTEEVKSWRRSLLRSVATSVLVVVVALIVQSAYTTVARHAAGSLIPDPIPGWIFTATLVALAWSIGSSAYCGYKLWRLEQYG